MMVETPPRNLVVQPDGSLVPEAAAPAPDPVPAPGRSPAFERLHLLVRKGYVAEIGVDSASDTIVLRHLGKAPDLVLHSDGLVEGYEGRRPRYKRNIDAPAAISAERDAEHLRFMKFLDTVPRASLRDRTRPWRTKYVYIPFVLLAVWGVCLLFTAALMDL